MSKILVSAGEISGDMYASRIVRALKEHDFTLEFVGMGHKQMELAGVRIITDVVSVSTIGILEPFKHIPKLLTAYYKMKKALKVEKPDVVVVIDYQGYHMPFIKVAKRLGIPVVYYISPQEWQWGTDKGGQQVVQYTDKILAIFSQEERFYNRLGGHVSFVGHPIMDAITLLRTKDQFYETLGVDKTKPILAVFPGSRSQEISLLLPVFLKSIQNILSVQPNVAVVVSIASDVYRDRILKLISAFNLADKVIVFSGNQHDLINNSYLSIVTSGTVTLEHTCLETPFIATYRFGFFSYWIAKLIFGKRLKRIPYISLPNLLARKKIVPEFLQQLCTVNNIANEAISLLTDSFKYETVKHSLKDIKKQLGSDRVAEKAALEILKFIKK